MKIRNYYCSTVTVTLDDGTFKHVAPGEVVDFKKADAERFLEQAPNRFELVKEPKPKGVKNGK
jgi:hypothetical protein